MDVFRLIFHKLLLTVLSLIFINVLTIRVKKSENRIEASRHWIWVYLSVILYYTFLGRPLTIFFEQYDFKLFANLVLGIFCLAPVVFFIKIDRERISDIGLGATNAVISIGVGIALGLSYYIYLYILQGEKWTLNCSIGFISVKIGYKFLRALTNEIVFRGYIQKRLVISRGPILGILISSILYAAACSIVTIMINEIQISMLMFWFGFKLTAGMIYGYLAYRTDSIYGSAILGVMTNIG